MILLTRECLGAFGTALAGVLLFSLSSSLPAPFPPSVTRFVGIWAVALSLFPIWVITESWPAAALTGGICFAVIILVHVRQMRKPSVPPASTALHAPPSEQEAGEVQVPIVRN